MPGTYALAVASLVLVAAAPPALARPGPVVLPGAHLHPESVSITPDGTAWVSSMGGGILKANLRTGKVTQFVAPGAFGSGAQFGILADRRHGIVWTCSNAFPAVLPSVAGADPGHWLKGFDMRTGKGKVSLALPGQKPVCNDMAVGPDGALYVTDTGQPRILRWVPGASALAVWLEDPVLGANGTGGGIDGIAFAADGSMLVNNVRSGALFRVAMAGSKPGAVTQLTLSRPLANPDGMRPIAANAFILAEGAGKVSRLTLDGDKVTVTTLAEGIDQPTGVDVGLGQGWYVQGQLSAIFRPGGARVELPFRLVPVSLKP